MNKKPYIISLTALIMSIVLGNVLSGQKTYPEITKDSKRIEIKVETMKNRKGFLILNDSVTVYGGLKQTVNSIKINNSSNLQLEDISPPYLLTKQLSENYLELIKNYETYFFDLNYE